MKTIITTPDGTEFTVDNCQRVAVIYDQVDIPGEDGPGEAHIVCSPEGVVRDIYTSRESPLDNNIGTSSETLGELVDRLVDGEGSHAFAVRIAGCTAEQAERVMQERLGHDEDYGFNYTLNW